MKYAIVAFGSNGGRVQDGKTVLPGKDEIVRIRVQRKLRTEGDVKVRYEGE